MYRKLNLPRISAEEERLPYPVRADSKGIRFSGGVGLVLLLRFRQGSDAREPLKMVADNINVPVTRVNCRINKLYLFFN